MSHYTGSVYCYNAADSVLDAPDRGGDGQVNNQTSKRNQEEKTSAKKPASCLGVSRQDSVISRGLAHTRLSLVQSLNAMFPAA
jgi:hypothetical protein